MPRKKTHKIAVQIRGLDNQQAARLHYIVQSAARAFTDDYETASNVPLAVLRASFPNEGWRLAAKQERVDLVD